MCVWWGGVFAAHQAEDGCERAAPVVVAAAEFEVEQQSVVRHQVQAVGVHQGLTAQGVSVLEAWRVDPTWRGHGGDQRGQQHMTFVGCRSE